MVSLLRLLFSLALAAATFVVAFLTVFLPLLLRDMHGDPHDGQGGLGGVLLAACIALGSALLAGAIIYVRAEKNEWFSNGKQQRS